MSSRGIRYRQALGAQKLFLKITVNRNGRAVPYQALNLEGLEPVTNREIMKALRDEARQTRVRARHLLHQRILYPEKSTGRLERSIGWTTTSKGVTLYAGAPYGGYVELGWSRFMGHHFMKDAVEEARMRLPKAIDKACKVAFDQLIFRGDRIWR